MRIWFYNNCRINEIIGRRMNINMLNIFKKIFIYTFKYGYWKHSNLFNNIVLFHFGWINWYNVFFEFVKVYNTWEL